MFNAKKWMNDYGIPFHTSGKNISSNGWVGLNCIFCGDRSSHMGIPPSGANYSCFRCGAKGTILTLIKTILQIQFSEAKEIYARYSSALDTGYYDREVKNRANSVIWDRPEFEKEMPSIFAQYLHKRQFNPSQIEELYGVKCCYLTGDFKYRLVIPVVQGDRIVTYVGRDVTDKSTLRYKNLKEELSVLPAKECVYNIDNVSDTAIIVEGITDVWRLRYNAVATLGLVHTKRQVRLLSKRLKKAFICFDSEDQAQEMAKVLGEELAMSGVDTYIVAIDKADPGMLSEKEAEHIRKVISKL